MSWVSFFVNFNGFKKTQAKIGKIFNTFDYTCKKILCFIKIFYERYKAMLAFWLVKRKHLWHTKNCAHETYTIPRGLYSIWLMWVLLLLFFTSTIKGNQKNIKACLPHKSPKQLSLSLNFSLRWLCPLNGKIENFTCCCWCFIYACIVEG